MGVPVIKQGKDSLRRKVLDFDQKVLDFDQKVQILNHKVNSLTELVMTQNRSAVFTDHLIGVLAEKLGLTRDELSQLAQESLINKLKEAKTNNEDNKGKTEDTENKDTTNNQEQTENKSEDKIKEVGDEVHKSPNDQESIVV